METYHAYIPLLEGHAQILDLTNALTPLNGVGEVRVDATAHILTIQYDPDYADEGTLRAAVLGAGYPIGSQHGTA